jgi:hypothetical protein
VPTQSPHRPATRAAAGPATPPPSHLAPSRTHEKPTLPPQAPLLTPNPQATPDPDPLLNPALLSLLMSLMPPEQKSQLIAIAKATKNRLDNPDPKTPSPRSAMMPDSSST